MVHFAVLCPESPGHLNPMSTLLSELTARGHQVTWFGLADVAAEIEKRGFRSVVVAEDVFPIGSYDRILKELGELKGFAAARYSINIYRQAIEAGLKVAPELIAESGAEALLIDESVFSGRTLADVTGLPWISVCNALPLFPDPYLPPCGFSWSYGTSIFHRLRNRFGYLAARMMLGQVKKVIDQYRRERGLAGYHFMEENASSLATLAQISAEFDYPRRHQPEWFHYIGGLHNLSSRPQVEFPFDRLDGRPLVYASMGTAQNRLLGIFRNIALACQPLPVQLVISMGGGGDPEDLGELPGEPIVVKYAPQLELIEKSKLVITHAGMNTTAESIAAGKPMVTIPVTNDQPSVAARVQHTGCGICVPLNRGNSARLQNAVQEILDNESYSINASQQAEYNRKAGGAAAGADIIENVLKSA